MSGEAAVTGPGEAQGLGFEASVAQIVSARGVVAGAGFLAGADVVVTCAHVVRAAGSGPGERVGLVFPWAPGAARVEGEVLAEAWRAPEADDVAVIRLDAVVEGTGALAVGSADGCRGHGVRSFGFPAQAPPGGHFGYGTAGDLLPARPVGGGGLLQLTDANDLARGFSGGPVVDEVSGLVIGMVTSLAAPDEHLRGQGIAYATPVQALREVWPALSERQVRPYLGLEPFTAGTAKFFHGREAGVEALLSALGRQPRVLLLLGPSGSGKSSLVQAGLLPTLAEGRLPGSDQWLPVLVPRPGQDLLAELDRHGLAGIGSGGLAAAVRQRLDTRPHRDEERLVLVIDQFEEVFTRPERELLLTETGPPPSDPLLPVLEQLAEAIGSRAPLSVILVMRDDFYPQLAAQAPALLEAAAPGLVNVPATLSEQDLHAIITRPAAEAGTGIEAGLSERIITDVLAANPHGALARRAPVTVLAPLELVLSQLWERRSDGRLTHAAYERIGQFAGALTTWCNTAVSRLPEDHHATARRILTALVRPADPARQIPATRQQVPLSVLHDLAADAPRTVSGGQFGHQVTDEVLAALTRHRIITTHARNPGPPPTDLVAELAHDTLTRDWNDLREWVGQDHRFHTWLRRAEDQQIRWNDRHTPGDLLHGTDLAEGLDWARRRQLPATIEAFVAASHRSQQAALRRTRRLNAVLVGVVILALTAASLAFWQRQSAVTARQQAITSQRQALSRQLAAQSAALLDTSPDLASLLAVQAYRTSPTAEATTSLYVAADSPLQRTLLGHHDIVTSVAFSPDGHTLAAGSRKGSVQLWDAATGRTRITLTSGQGGMASVAFSPDGRTLAAGDDDGSVRLWDAATGRTRITLTSGHDGVASVAFSPDGRTLAAGSGDGSAWLWDTATGHSRPVLTSQRAVASVAFSPDGRSLAVGDYGGSVWLWDTATGRTRITLTGQGFMVSVAFSPDGRTLATGSNDDGAVQLWDAATGRTRTTLTGQGGTVSVAFSPDGRTLAAGSGDGSVQLWDAATGRTRTTLTGQGLMVLVAFSPDGRTLATGSGDGSVRLWDAATGRPRTTLTSPREVSSVAFSPDGRTLAVGNIGGSVQLWDAATGRPRTTLTSGHDREVSSVAFSPDGRTLATGNDDGSVQLWDTATGRTRITLTSGHDREVSSVAFSPDGRTLATGNDDGPVQLWDTATGRTLATLTVQGLMASVAFSPDGRILATGNDDGPVRLWDTATGRTRITLTSGHDGVTSVAFSPDGRTLATGSTDRSVRLWDAATGHTRATFTGHTEWVTSVAFSPDGRTLATGSTDRSVRLWGIALPDPAASITKICRSIGRDLTGQEWATYLVGQRPRPVCT